MFCFVKSVCIPDNVQDVGNQDKILHLNEDWGSLVYWAADRKRDRKGEKHREKERKRKRRGRIMKTKFNDRLYISLKTEKQKTKH